MLHLSIEHLERLIRRVMMSQPFTKLRSVEADRLETDMRSASTGMDGTVMKNFEDSFLIIPILQGCHVSFSTAIVSQLQLRHLHWLVSVQSVNNIPLSVPLVLHFLSHGEAAQLVETQ
jgi:hypothetical protein